MLSRRRILLVSRLCSPRLIRVPGRLCSRRLDLLHSHRCSLVIILLRFPRRSPRVYRRFSLLLSPLRIPLANLVSSLHLIRV